MAERKRKAGEKENLLVRRVGHRHCVVTPERTTRLVDINQVLNTIERLRVRKQQAERVKAQAEQAIEQATAELAQQEGFLLAFESMSIDRIDGDPVVPLEAPEPAEPPKAESPGAGGDA